MVPRAAIIKCWDTWHEQFGLISKQKCCFVSRVFLSYKYLISSFYFSLFHLCKPRESCHFVIFAVIYLLIPSPL